jgi:hypothetical protein
MRTVRRSVALMAAGTLLLGGAAAGLWASSSSADDSGSGGFSSLSLSAVAGGQRILADEPAGQPPGTVDSGVPDAEAQMTSSTGHALSSAAWPTALAGNLGTLLALLGPSPCTPGSAIPAQCSPVTIPSGVMQQYPLLNSPIRAEAQYPTHQQDQNSLPGASMSARADGIKAVADAVLGAAQAAKSEAFGSMHANSSVGLNGANTAVADAVSSADNLAFGGGLITIGSVASEAHATTDGTVAKSTGSTTVHDMKVNGIPVFVDGSGVHAGSVQVPDAPGTAIVNQLIAGAGYKVSVTQPTTTTNGGSTSYDAGSLLITWDTGVDPNTHKHKYVYFVFGGATVTASATPGFQLPGVGASTPTGIPPSLGSSSAPGFAGGEVGAPSSGPSSITTGGPSTTPSAGVAISPALASTKLPKGISPVWVVLAVLGSGLIAGGIRRLPDRVLDQVASTCPLEEEP